MKEVISVLDICILFYRRLIVIKSLAPEDYHNKPGTILTYTFKEYFIAPNKTYDLYRSIFLTGISLLAGLLVTFPLLFGTIDISEEMASTLMIATLILLGTSILSYNFVI